MPFLIPWYVSEKLFQIFLQPAIVKRYRIGQIQEKKKKFRLRPRTVLLVLVFLYLAVVAYNFAGTQSSLLSALSNAKLFVIFIYNDLISLVNAVLSPLNKLLFFAQGGEVAFWDIALAFYLLFLPLIIISNLIFCFMTTRVMLQSAVKLRNQADQDVNIVGYSERAQKDEIFFGLDLDRNAEPFYAKVGWLQGHTQVIGSPGSGKTESIIQPFWFQSVRRNVPTIVLDGKASARNIDSFYTIATSLAQGHEILYFNPSDPARSATYNPLQHGNVEEVKNRLLGAINWTQHSAISREKLSYYLGVVLQAIQKSKRRFTLAEILRYFDSNTHVQNQLYQLSDPVVRDSLDDLLHNYSRFQKETAFFTLRLIQICNTAYANLLSDSDPELDLLDVYVSRKDCYFSLPIGPNDPAMAFLGRLILGDIQATFHSLSVQGGYSQNGQEAGGGILIIDELAKFASPQFIDLLRAGRNLGVSVCYTNQTLAELENPELQLGKAFIDELAEHTNVIFCFNLSGPETVQAIASRMGGGDVAGIDAAEIIKQLDVGRCVVFVRQPRVFNILKTGYFKFDKLMSFQKEKQGDVLGV
jgi:hypothetical protein